MDNLIKQIIKNKLPVYFISPHLDDAVFSAGDLMAHLSQKTNVQVINVFTAGDTKHQTISAKMFLRQCGIKNAELLFKIRKLEDSSALAKINITSKNLDFKDALWRSRQTPIRFLPELSSFYPTYKFHIIKGKISPHDPIRSDLKNRLKRIIPKNAVVFVPIGIGNHVDHLIVRNVCTELFKNIIFWSDFPYNQHHRPNKNFIELFKLKKTVFKTEIKKKREMILSYVTQVQAIFGNSVNDLPREVYYLKAIL
jgi:LmbE family N-acetylglucosaminyl deacetylase